ncbi:MFS transporter [Antrihabitans sp. YC2-6]|nr:MFS transporter [Antrihabitans sp. YC2-6]
MNLAVPRIAEDLDASAPDLQWVISAYMLALGAFMVPGGRIGDMYGRRRALLGGIALFGLSSVGCALAPSAEMLIGARVVQGIGAALIFPVSVSVLTNAFPAVRAGRAIGLCYGIAGLGNAAGPLVGGLLTEELSWRAIFWLNVPLTIAALVLGVLTITESSDESAPRRLDIAGLALITVGIGVFTLAFDRAPTWGWLSAATIGAFALAIAVLVGFVLVETRVPTPLVDLTLLRQSRFTVLMIAGTIANIAYAVTIFGSTLYLQQGRGLSPLAAGIVFLGPSAGAALGGPLSGRLAARHNPVQVMGIACISAAVALGALTTVTSWPLYVPVLTACGFTMGLVYAFTTVATQSVVRPERAGEAAGVTLTSLVTLAGVGVAVSASALEMMQAHGASIAGALDRVFLVLAAGLFAAGAAVLATRGRRQRTGL